VLGTGADAWALVEAWRQRPGAPAVHRLDGLPRRSVRRAWTMGRARWWIAGGDAFGTPPAHTDIVIVPETPIRRTGRLSPDWDVTPASGRIPSPGRVRHWARVVTPNAGLAGWMRARSGFDGPVLSAAPLIERGRRLRQSRMRGDDPRAVLLYAPSEEVGIDLAALVEAVGDRVQVLIRCDRGASVTVPSVLRTTVTDASRVDDVAALLAQADLVVTDTSPLLWSAVQLGLPVIVHAPGLDDLVARIGTKIDLRVDGPGPVTSDLDELVDAVRATLDRRCAPDPAFVEGFEKLRSMGAAEGSVDDVLAVLEGGR